MASAASRVPVQARRLAAISSVKRRYSPASSRLLAACAFMTASASALLFLYASRQPLACRAIRFLTSPMHSLRLAARSAAPFMRLMSSFALSMPALISATRPSSGVSSTLERGATSLPSSALRLASTACSSSRILSLQAERSSPGGGSSRLRRSVASVREQAAA